MMRWSKKQAPPIRSLIGKDTVVQGNLTFTQGLRIDGQVIGDEVADGDDGSTLVISRNDRVFGRVSASHVIIS